jgi:Kef-type K+ transport system membrane component KefB
MEPIPQILLALGSIFMLGLATDLLGRRTALPRVTLLLVFGVIIGPEIFDLIPDAITHRFELITDMTLLMVGFLLGGRFTRQSFNHSINSILSISLSAVIVTVAMVFLGLVLFGVPLEIALLLGCIASATAPAATVDVVIESHHKSPFANLLLSVVALDDAWALIIFAVGIAIVASLNGTGEAASPLVATAREIGGAALIGGAIGLPAAYLTGRIRPGQPMLVEALGLVFICGGLAIWLHVSFLIAAMVMGAVIANLAKHHEYPFHAIEDIEWPFMVIFFVLAGASLEFVALKTIGLIGMVYILSRTIGKLLGASLGCYLGNTDPATQRWMGAALLPQAGAAMGMALVAASQFPDYRQTLLSIVISSSIIFEIVGPIFTRMALERTQP